MPNFDAGTYFLSILVPVKTGLVPAEIESRSDSWDARFRDAMQAETVKDDLPVERETAISWVQRLRMVLATLPTALQSPATERIGRQSPFARNRRNHLSRFVVINDVVYNGRITAKPVIGGGGNPLRPQKVDHLKSPYLFFSADVDAVTKDGASLPTSLSEAEQNTVRDSYLEELWRTAEPEMRAVFENCVGFEKVTTAQGFASYLASCQVETTMPFHDYWVDAPDIPSLPLKLFGGVGLVLLAAILACPLVWLIDLIFDAGWDVEAAGWISLWGLILGVIALIIAYFWINRLGNTAFPPPKYGNLPTVLKSLYLQQNFADFVIANQGASDADLHAAFGTFLETHKPADTDSATQKPGYISSRYPGAVQP